MLQQPTEKAAYCDASAYFSEEEWKLLQQWQEELHQNVMKEIDQALTSLGPVIATMVFSLRAKAEQEPCLMEDQGSERRHNSNTSPSGMIIDPELFRITKKENLHRKNPQDTQEERRNDCLSTEGQQSSIFIDDFGEEVDENSTDSHSGQDIISFYIKEEGDAYCVDTLDNKQKESTYNSTGRDIISFCINEEEAYFTDKQNSNPKESTYTSIGMRSEMRKRNTGDRIEYTEKITVDTVLHEEANRKVAQSPEKGENPNVQLQSGINRKLQEEKIAHCEDDVRSQEYATFITGACSIPRSDSHNKTLSHHTNVNLPECPKNTHTSYGPYACPDCEKMFKTNQDLTRHQRTHSGERPYHCIECGKRFTRSHHLTAHQRTHTGERPFQCTVCGKSFSLKGNLKAHHNTHMMAYRKQLSVGLTWNSSLTNISTKEHC